MTDVFIKDLSSERLSESTHGPVGSMGVEWYRVPTWDDLDFAALPEVTSSADDVETALVLGADRGKPLALEIPLIVSDMSFGSLSMEAKVTLAEGAELAGTAICSGEGGILADEQKANTRYMYELGTGEFGFHEMEDKERKKLEPLWPNAQAFHFKGGQAAKTGTGGHLPAAKVTGRIAATRGKPRNADIISPPTFESMASVKDFRDRVDHVRERMGDVPIGFKLSANHLREDIEFALEIGVDYIILDGRGGSTGAAPLVFRDHISIPTIPALVTARRVLDDEGVSGKVKLIITGGLRTPVDFAKALALGADGVGLANSALQAIGCIGARRCHTNQCPAGIATQNRAYIDKNFKGKPEHLRNFLNNSVEVMKRIAKACGHGRLAELTRSDLKARTEEMARLSGVAAP